MRINFPVPLLERVLSLYLLSFNLCNFCHLVWQLLPLLLLLNKIYIFI